jgi:hypothetical protein
MLIAAANVRANDFENDAVFAFSGTQREFREIDGLDLHLPWTHIG